MQPGLLSAEAPSDVTTTFYQSGYKQERCTHFLNFYFFFLNHV